ncbi:MAG: threonylcarbamoyl-AMP synthase [Alphaproteobacteria bacterium]|nr:threonylcarbamoyl-AMP synthase [Alphaproteobacteria bacterium]|tara:strand:- start:17199 stop:18176 length:978 start_codon:yes stop_codon:yes gene_type:complete
MKIIAANQNAIEQAATILKEGGLIGMPTETVYGLAANALDGKAVARIFEAKGRPSFNPLITHFGRARDIEPYAEMDERAKALAQKFWPGPLTMILKRKTNCPISDLVTAGLPTLAVRVPDHKAAQDLIRAAGVPLAAPSANPSGTLSPTSAAHVARTLGDKVDLVLAAGSSRIGLESTVIDLSTEQSIILRPGGITPEELEETLGHKLHIAEQSDDIKSPGQLLKHYAPKTPLRLNAVDLNPDEALLAFGSTKFMGIKGGGAATNLPEDMIRNLSETGDLHEAASNLFTMLHDMDAHNHRAIAVMSIPDIGVGIAINDRLKRAAN